MILFTLLCIFTISASAANLPRIHVNDLYDHPSIYNTSRPFILEGAIQYPKKVKSFLWLKKVYGKNVADFFRNNLDRQGAGLFLYSFEKALSELQPPQYLHMQLVPSDWAKLGMTLHPWLVRDHWMSPLTPAQIDEYSLKTHWKVMLIGTPGAGMFNHTDGLRSSSWHLHVKGKKRWTICKYGKCTTDILEPGDVLFYPKDYWHETKCLSNPTITITDTILTPENHDALSERLWQQCVSPERQFMFSASLCDSLQHALKWQDKWRSIAVEDTVEMREDPSHLGNNYDGRNYITR